MINFKNAIIVMTSNLGSKTIQDFARNVGQRQIGYYTKDEPATNDELIRQSVQDELQAHFKPEFLNRIDEIVIFHALLPAQLRDIVDIQIERLVARILVMRDINMKVTEHARSLLAERGYDPAFGARPLKRVIQSQLLDPLALKIISGGIGNGSTVTVGAREGTFTFDIQSQTTALKIKGHQRA